MPDLRRHASVPCLSLPPGLPRGSSAAPSRRLKRSQAASEAEGVQSWDEYHSIRDAQMVRRPAARRSLRLNLEVAARSDAQPVPVASNAEGAWTELCLLRGGEDAFWCWIACQGLGACMMVDAMPGA